VQVRQPLALFLLAVGASAAEAAPQTVFHVPAGQTVVYDTANGPIIVDDVIVEAGGTLRIVGQYPLRMRALQAIRIDGVVDASGFDALSVATMNTTNLSEPGALGAAGGGDGGLGNPNTTISSPKGGDGAGHFQADGIGGGGGESGVAFSAFVDLRRGAGGGGGALAPDQPVNSNPSHPANIGLVAENGHDNAQALGALTLTLVAHGGRSNALPFANGNPLDDFWGTKLELATGTTFVGEFASPVPGRGAGAGGNASRTASYPHFPFDPTGDQKGAGGGGGGGLAILFGKLIRVGPQGIVRANGGKGAAGENTLFLNRVGGGSGGGSGGFLILQARKIDLTVAQPHCITAIGGRGGRGMNNNFDMPGAGGNGGPGVVQLHVSDGLPTQVLLPAGKSIADMTSPDAHVLMPDPSL